MAFNNSENYQHDSAETLGILMVNLGTPNSPTTGDVRRYLKEFLSDPRVIEIPKLIWWFVLNGVILNTRPSKTAKAYQKVWQENGSPLLSISQKQQKALQTQLDQRLPGPCKVVLAMRYGQPSIQQGLNELKAANARRVLILPMYPQYSATTTAAVFDEVTKVLQKERWLPELRFINQYHDHPTYIDALAESIREHWQQHGEPDKLVMSFHGIPQDYFLNGDPYYCQCQKTGRLLADALLLSDDQWLLTFQSRVGPKEWLRPYTDETLKALPELEVSQVHVVTPGFSADCLETIEEIGEENRDYFLSAGGKDYSAIPCLNAREGHIEMLAELVVTHTQGWPESNPHFDRVETHNEIVERSHRADVQKEITQLG